MICAYCFIVRNLQIDAVSVYRGTAHCLEHLELVSNDGEPHQNKSPYYCGNMLHDEILCCVPIERAEECRQMLQERFHKEPHEALDGHTWKGGQPRQADPSGAVSSSTTSEQPADPAAPPAYCNAKTQWYDIEVTCCQDSGHAAPHESFGGVQW